VSCGQHIPGRLGRLTPAGVRHCFPELAALDDKYLYGNLWASRESAQMSNDLNAANHGHAGATYGPVLTDSGWAAAVDLRPAMVAAEQRADLLQRARAGLDARRAET